MSIKKSIPQYLLSELVNLIEEMGDGLPNNDEEFRIKMVTDEVLRQNELRIEKHRRLWGCDPNYTEIAREDIVMARKYLNTVETWEGWDRNVYEREA
jgi:hypothetical protein